MTGFAAVTREDADVRVHVTAKSVNHRFLDIGVKAPQALAQIDLRLKPLIQARLSRGRVDVMVTVEHIGLPVREVRLDELLVEQVAQALSVARAKGLVSGGLTAGDVLRLPQVLDIRMSGSDPGGLAPPHVVSVVEAAASEALDALVVMRETEGRHLAGDLDARVAALSAWVDELERLAREGQATLEARLRERLSTLPADVLGDGTALAQEVVRFAARSDVEEEIVRMRGHVDHWRGLASGAEPCGRKLDFLVQEMNREINTIGSKAEGPRATEVVIAAKAELERIREQVQNVE